MSFSPNKPALCKFNNKVVVPNPKSPKGAGLAVVSLIDLSIVIFPPKYNDFTGYIIIFF